MLDEELAYKEALPVVTMGTRCHDSVKAGKLTNTTIVVTTVVPHWAKSNSKT